MMTIPASQDAATEAEVRFAHLLQPIKDLAKNWNIDLASELEEYLEQIENIPISFDGGATKMNFAEAALLIQGSACVYSRKVEYLYDLVKQMLGVVGPQQRKQQVGDAGNQGDQTVITKFPDEEFLSLDDIVEHKNIDLKNDTLDNCVDVMPQTPITLLKMDASEKADFPLISRKGEILGSRKDFKLNVCSVHPLSGTLLLDMSHLQRLEESFRNKLSSTPFSKNNPDAAEMDLQASHDLAPPSSQTDTDHMAQDDIPDATPLLHLSGGEEEDVDMAEEAALPAEEPRKSARHRLPRPTFQPTKPDVDFWSEIDPFVEGSKKVQSLKKGRKFQLPLGLESEELKKRKRGKRISDVKALDNIADFCLKIQQSYRAKCTGVLKEPPIPALESLYWKTQQKWQSERAKWKKMVSCQNDQNPEEEEEEVVGGVEEEEEGNHIDDPIPFDAVAGDHMSQDCTNDLDPNEPILSSYEQLVRQYVDGYLASAEQYAQITELSKRVSDWENKILPKLEEEEAHDGFDIHVCGTHVINAFKAEPENTMQTEEPDSSTIEFRKMVKNKPQYEVCRIFLATLQLANTYNVQIDVEGDLSSRMDAMRITLLNTQRHCDALAEYRAPSVEN
ncbi:hypothetical protein CAPTEDRAFT_219248 [Capitella teleta]|uniref:Condensin-2 complex subunit H2 n=1 Tax=Capitella teleta TaxID=283909 RepID=R7V2S7_CAPTE|nr:hypothetical protein CAPTEDRAFT_219248 [Capitella teleta]|eukprot:ELU12854.1 hypothetical protein CAPTEDRAFT_219248 [Capitella teleta]